MSQTASVVVQSSPRVGTFPVGMNMSQPNPFLQQREITLSPQTLSTSEPTFTALPVHPSREPPLPSAPTQRPVPYRGAISHHPQASVSSHVSHESFSHRRRGSTLKTVMRKIFGKKRQSILEGDETDEESSILRIERSRNIAGAPDPISIGKARSRNSNTSPSAANQKRSLAVSRLSSASSDVLAEDSKYDLPYTVRRRATLPSLVLSDDEGNTKERTLSIISPISTRPVSAMSTVSAITGHCDTESLHTHRAHRRSRSADDLQALIRRHRMSPIQWRRRSKETKDWRTSVLEPYDQEDTAYNDHDIVNTPEHEVDPPRDSKTPVADEEVATRSTEVESPPFQGQSLIANMADPDASVDQRLTTIEVKLMDLEFAIAKMQGSGNDGTTKTAETTPEKAKLTTQNIAAYRDQLCAASETSSDSASFGGNGRPISTSTLRPSMVLNQPPPWQPGSSLNLHGISIEQYSALVTLLRREQTARKTLESQVALLQEEMQTLRRSSGIPSVLPASPPGTLYPIPSPDSDDGRYRRRRTMSSPRKDSDTRNSEPQQWGSPDTRSKSNTGKRTSSRTTAANMI